MSAAPEPQRPLSALTEFDLSNLLFKNWFLSIGQPRPALSTYAGRELVAPPQYSLVLATLRCSSPTGLGMIVFLTG